MKRLNIILVICIILLIECIIYAYKKINEKDTDSIESEYPAFIFDENVIFWTDGYTIAHFDSKDFNKVFYFDTCKIYSSDSSFVILETFYFNEAFNEDYSNAIYNYLVEKWNIDSISFKDTHLIFNESNGCYYFIVKNY